MAGEIAFFTMAALFSILFVGNEISKWRHDKKRQQLESKTPYDYALTNAINERDRLQDELRTIQSLKRTETDTERIRNEIDTILSDDGEGASESVYDGKKAYMRSCEATDEQFLRMIEWQKEDTENRHPAARAALERERQDEDLGILVEELTALKVEMEEAADIISKADAKAYGINVREDDTKDEQLLDNGVEYADLEAIDKAIRDEQKVLCDYRNNTGEGFSGNGLAVGTIVNFRYHNGQTRYLTLRVRHTHKGGTYITHIRGEDLDEVSLLGGETHGEIIYRKATI